MGRRTGRQLLLRPGREHRADQPDLRAPIPRPPVGVPRQVRETGHGPCPALPKPYALTEPQLISLTDRGDRLIQLIADDEDLRERALELGFRIRFNGEDGTSERLNTYLRDRGIQVPTPNRDQTKVYEPDLDVLEEIINYVGNCPLPVQDVP
ncbi:hypothetical protein ACFQ0G_51870 [Streptomyces chiangmaiensis]